MVVDLAEQSQHLVLLLVHIVNYWDESDKPYK